MHEINGTGTITLKHHLEYTNSFNPRSLTHLLIPARASIESTATNSRPSTSTNRPVHSLTMEAQLIAAPPFQLSEMPSFNISPAGMSAWRPVH